MMTKAIRYNPYSHVPSVPDTPELDLITLFKTPNDKVPLELEIGFGKGRFLLDRADALKEHAFLGIETRRKWVQLVIDRMGKQELTNVNVLHGDARSVLNRTMGDSLLARVFINFPDPWWKARHEKRMVVCPELLVDIQRLLVEGGDLFVQTDVDFRAEAYLELVKATKGLVPVSGDGIVEQNPFGARSLREIRCEETGLPIYRIHFKKIQI